MGTLTRLAKVKDITVSFASRASHFAVDAVFVVLSYTYLNILLLGLSSHPRIAHRSFEVERLHSPECPNANKSWDKFVKFVLNDCKVAGALCWCIIMATALVSAMTYHSDPVTCQITLVAVLPPAFGMTQAFCIVWHLKSTSNYPNAPFHWKKVTASNARSPFIRTTSLLAAPVAWTLWSALSFIMILFVVLFRGLPIPASGVPEVSPRTSNWFVELVNLIVTYGAEGSAEALLHLSVASRICAAVILAIGCVHLAITVFFFTRLCLPQEAPTAQDVLKTSPINSPSHSTPPSPSQSPLYSPSPPYSPLSTPDIATEGPSPTEPYFPPKLYISTNPSYSASTTPSTSPDTGLFMSPFVADFPSPTTTLYATSPITSSPHAGKSPPEHDTPPSADGNRFPPKAVLRHTPIATRSPLRPF